MNECFGERKRNKTKAKQKFNKSMDAFQIYQIYQNFDTDILTNTSLENKTTVKLD